MNEDIGDVVRLTMKGGDVRIVVTPGLEGVRSTNEVLQDSIDERYTKRVFDYWKEYAKEEWDEELESIDFIGS